MITKKTEFTASGLVFNKDKVLMIKRLKHPWPGKWSFIGGHVNPGELPHETIAREIFEESDIKVGVVDVINEPKHFKGVYRTPNPLSIFYFPVENHFHISFLFLCKARVFDICVKQKEKEGIVQWIDPKKADISPYAQIGLKIYKNWLRKK